MAAVAGAGPAQNQKPEVSSESPTWVHWTISTAFTGTLSGNQIASGAARIQTGFYMGY